MFPASPSDTAKRQKQGTSMRQYNDSSRHMREIGPLNCKHLELSSPRDYPIWCFVGSDVAQAKIPGR